MARPNRRTLQCRAICAARFKPVNDEVNAVVGNANCDQDAVAVVVDADCDQDVVIDNNCDQDVLWMMMN